MNPCINEKKAGVGEQDGDEIKTTCNNPGRRDGSRK
jgi:hypothetical protein